MFYVLIQHLLLLFNIIILYGISRLKYNDFLNETIKYK